MAVVTSTDRPKSVRNLCVIDVFGGVFVLSRCFSDLSVVVGAFVIRLSQISSFFSYNNVHFFKYAFSPSIIMLAFFNFPISNTEESACLVSEIRSQSTKPTSCH